MTNNEMVKNLANVIAQHSEVMAAFIVAAKEALDASVEVQQEIGMDVAKPVKEGRKVSSRKEREEQEQIPEEFTEESLAEVSYNGLKKIAKELGISASGDRDTLTTKILAEVSGEEDVPADDEEQEDDVEDAEIVEEESAESEDEDEDDEEVDAEDEETLEDRIIEATKDMTVEELSDVLVNAGLPAKGKRQALIASIIKGVEEGKIEFGDDEDEESEEGVVEEEQEEEEVVEEKPVKKASKTAKPVKKTKLSPREKACKEYEESIKAEFEDGEITRKDMIDYINKRMGTKSRMNKTSDEELITKYIELQVTLIDDDGELHDEGEAYVLNDSYYCCGEQLVEATDDDGAPVLKCEICGAEYSGDDEDEE